MSWMSKINLQNIPKKLGKSIGSIPDKLWLKCPITGDPIFCKTLDNKFHVTPAGHHFPITVSKRLYYLFGKDVKIIPNDHYPDPDRLNFVDLQKYADRLKNAKSKNNNGSAITIAQGSINDISVITLVQNFSFMGGSLGVNEGLALTQGIDIAKELNVPLIIFVASGGARMQEGLFSLMQMPGVVSALIDFKKSKMPYIVVYTHPTTGGVAASYASLGDIHIAEPGALIGFSGPRVIKETIKTDLPESFQKSEFLLEKGFVDAIVHRKDMKNTLYKILSVLLKKEKNKFEKTTFNHKPKSNPK